MRTKPIIKINLINNKNYKLTVLGSDSDHLVDTDYKILKIYLIIFMTVLNVIILTHSYLILTFNLVIYLYLDNNI